MSGAAAAVGSAAAVQAVVNLPITALRAAHHLLATRNITDAVVSLRCGPAGDVAAVFGSGTPPEQISARVIDLAVEKNSHVKDGAGADLLSLLSRPCAASELSQAELSLQLLGRGLEWLHADVYGTFDTMRCLLAENAQMFGAGPGIEEVVAFKQKWLTQSRNYSIDAVHEVDLTNRVLVVSFECKIPGGEGRGTDVIQFDEHLKVCGVDAIRHARVGKTTSISSAHKTTTAS